MWRSSCTRPRGMRSWMRRIGMRWRGMLRRGCGRVWRQRSRWSVLGRWSTLLCGEGGRPKFQSGRTPKIQLINSYPESQLNKISTFFPIILNRHLAGKIDSQLVTKTLLVSERYFKHVQMSKSKWSKKCCAKEVVVHLFAQCLQAIKWDWLW